MAFGPNVKQEDDGGLEEDNKRYDDILEASGGEENGEARECVDHFEELEINNASEQLTNNVTILAGEFTTASEDR